MTYLEMVNAVMLRLREDEVTTVNESNYSKLIGAFVNDAKRLVEDAWDWSALRTTFPVTTVAGTSTYSLTGSGQRSEIFYVLDETNDREIRKESDAEINRLNTLTNNDTGEAIRYSLSGLDSNGDLQIKFYQTPDSSASIKVYGVKRSGDLSSDSDSVKVPSNPIIQWAYSYALIERGENGGQSGAEQAIFAQNATTTAIALDAGQHPEELIWTTV